LVYLRVLPCPRNVYQEIFREISQLLKSRILGPCIRDLRLQQRNFLFKLAAHLLINRRYVLVVGCLGRAIEGAQTTLGTGLSKARFWESVADFTLNDRQRLLLNRLLDGFEGKLTTSKWAKLAKCSQDTALRDILPLVERGILVRNPEGGRSTSYGLAMLAEKEEGEILSQWQTSLSCNIAFCSLYISCYRTG
jgi:hypothetical protein